MPPCIQQNDSRLYRPCIHCAHNIRLKLINTAMQAIAIPLPIEPCSNCRHTKIETVCIPASASSQVSESPLLPLSLWWSPRFSLTRKNAVMYKQKSPHWPKSMIMRQLQVNQSANLPSAAQYPWLTHFFHG